MAQTIRTAGTDTLQAQALRYELRGGVIPGKLVQTPFGGGGAVYAGTVHQGYGGWY